MVAGYRYIGWPPVHRRRFRHRSIRFVESEHTPATLMPEVVLPAFLLTVAGYKSI